MMDKGRARELTLVCKHGPSYEDRACDKCAQLFTVVEKAFDREVYNFYSRVEDSDSDRVWQPLYPEPAWESRTASELHGFLLTSFADIQSALANYLQRWAKQKEDAAFIGAGSREAFVTHE